MYWTFIVVALAVGGQQEQTWWWGPFQDVKACRVQRSLIVKEIADNKYTHLVMSSCMPLFPPAGEKGT